MTTKTKEERIFMVYGTLKKGWGNNRLLQTAEFIEEFTSPAEYTLFDGGFPVVERGGKTAIQGELFRTSDEEVINNVFSLEGCRKEQNHPSSWYTYDLIDTPFGQATMFVMDKGKSGRNTIVTSGKWH